MAHVHGHILHHADHRGGEEVIKYILIPEGHDTTYLAEEVLDDLVGYAYDDLNDALKASGYMSTVVQQTAKVYKMTIRIELEEVK